MATQSPPAATQVMVQPTSISSPIPTPTPTPSPAPPSATPVLTTTSPFIAQVFQIVQQLTREHSPRESASEQELEAAHHLLERFSTMGYETSLQEFTVTVKRARVKLTSGSHDILESPRALALTDSPFETATGRLTYVERAHEKEIPDDGLDGQIALITRGDITFEEKVNRVAQAGAVGAIIANNRKNKFYDWYADSPPIPALAISQVDGWDLIELAERGDVEATISVGMEDLSSQNIIAIVPSTMSTDRTVIIGAHYDTVISTEGASDNASGVAAVLWMAEHIQGHDYPFDVRVILFGAEEDGLLGSNHYVDNMSPDEIDNTIAMLNFDAFGNGTALMYMGENHLTLEASEFARLHGRQMRRFNEDRWATLGGAGDHAPFRTAGIPTISLISDDIEHINSPADELRLINPDLLGQATEIGLHIIEWLAAGAPARADEPQTLPTPTSTPKPMLLIPPPAPPAPPVPAPSPVVFPMLAALPTPDAGTAPSDREILVAFYESTGGDGWRKSGGWLTDAPLDDWYGVKTDSDGRVTGLRMTYNDLDGSLPREIGYLSELTVLEVSGYGLAGEIPPEIGHLTKLEALVLDSTGVSGAIPPEVGHLTNLERLSLSSTLVSGPLPIELGNLTNLKELRIMHTPLRGLIPRELGNLKNLVALRLSFNELRGEIPAELGNLHRLEQLGLTSNQLSGELPPELGGLRKLRGLALTSNQLTGTIPPEFGNLTELEALGLGKNLLHGKIPPELGNLRKLRDLSLFVNDLHGEIPPELGGLSYLTALDLRNNRLSGDFPQALGALRSLDFMGVGGNKGLTGCLPYDLHHVEPAGFDGVGLSQCTDDIPEIAHPRDRNALVTLYNATNGPNWTDSYLWLNEEASLSAWYGMSSGGDPRRAMEMRLYDNNLSGLLPPEIGDLPMLGRLNLGANNLEGEIPREIGKLTRLYDLNLPWNRLSGEIPPELENLSRLTWLSLYGNQLTGKIPAELGYLHRLKYFNLSDNQLSGPIPVELENLTQLRTLRLQKNMLTGEIPTELGNLKNLGSLMLSDNQLTGEIPHELTGLSELWQLYLSGNNLTGCIPPSLQKVRDNDLDRLGLPFCKQ